MSQPIFVFGSNASGYHGAGAALQAKLHHGAKQGIGIGPYGNSYAIPTKSYNLVSLSRNEIRWYVKDFINYARAHPELTFQVTQIGCGLAGHSARDIAPMFSEAPDNCSFDEAWREWLGDRNYWGHYE